MSTRPNEIQVIDRQTKTFVSSRAPKIPPEPVVPEQYSTEGHVRKTHSKYKPIELSEATVYDFAQNSFTMEQIAARFNVSMCLMQGHYQDAFNAGRDAAFCTPRRVLRRIINAFDSLEDNDFLRPDVPTGIFLKACEIHARKYEGYGKTDVQQVKVKVEGDGTLKVTHNMLTPPESWSAPE